MDVIKDMLAAIVKAPNILKVEEVPDPIIGDYDALVKISACSFCNGTDSKLIEGKFPGENNYPFILGHESVGKIIDVGKKVRKYKEGDWVLRPQAVYPQGFIGGVESVLGGFAELGVVTDYVTQSKEKPNTRPLSGFYSMQQILPTNIDPVKATIYITLKETYSWLKKVGLDSGKNVLILGSGPVGFAFSICARILGASKVIMTGRRDVRLALASKFGVDYTINISKENVTEKVRQFTKGKGVDLVIEAVGNYSLVNNSLKALAYGGKIGTYGVPSNDLDPFSIIKLDISNTPGDWTLNFTSPDEPKAHDEIINFVKYGFINIDDFITHRYTLKEIVKGFDVIKRKEALKVVITME
jgi:threonine dehydrogenase-like Zn-dependent dehydrogenase